MTKKVVHTPNLQQVPKSAFDISGPSQFGAKMQVDADRSHRVSKFGQHIVIAPPSGANPDKDFRMQRISEIKKKFGK